MKKFPLFFIFLLSLIISTGCRRTSPDKPLDSVEHRDTLVIKHWLSWNLLFTPGATGSTASVVQDFENYLNSYVGSINPTVTLHFQINHCPCDPQLTNIDATLVSGSGYTVPTPPTSPNPKPSGDYILSNNLSMSIPDVIDTANRVDLTNLTTDTATFRPAISATGRLPKLLAVIDTGLDTLTFKLAYPSTVWGGNLLWTSPAIPGATVTPTIYDVVPGESTAKLIDDNKVKHGTAATGIALSQIQTLDPSRIPHIMSIRAFDSSERGSIYTAGCAMNCAIENHANDINASWGYYGKEDSILKYYMVKAGKQNVRVFAAAGNTPGAHLLKNVCGGMVNKQNDLDRLRLSDSLFYPACFAPELSNLVSVTQLNRDPLATSGKIVPCFYQNYSTRYITVGALATPVSTVPCCSFRIPYLASNIEGSSFATPVVTGIVIATSPDNSLLTLKQFVHMKAHHLKRRLFTENGSYFDFPHLR